MNDEIIELTQDIVDELRYHVKRTGVGSTKLLNIFANQAPQDLSRSIVERVLKLKKKTVEKSHLDFILTSYRSLPDNDDIRTAITPELTQLIKHHQKRTGIGSIKLLKAFSDDVPTGLTHDTIDSIVRLGQQTANQNHIDFILKSYRLLPDRDVIVELTHEVTQEIKQHRERTGVGSINLLKLFSDDAPKGLKFSSIESIFRLKQKTFRKSYLEFILKSYRSLPDNDKIKLNKVPITDALEKAIAKQVKRTGLGGYGLVGTIKKKLPAGFNSVIADNITSKKVKSADKEHLDLLLSAYQSLPDNPRYMIDDKTIDEMKSHIKRTRLGVQALLRGKRHRTPKGFNSATIKSILLGKTKYVKREYVDFVLDEYRAVPDWDDVYIENNAHIRDELKSLASATGLPIARIFKSRDDLPDGLSIRSYVRWFHNKNPTRGINREHYAYLIKLFKSLAG